MTRLTVGARESIIHRMVNKESGSPDDSDDSTDRGPAIPAVHADGLTVVRGPRTVLRGLAFDVPRGQITGLLGPSGCALLVLGLGAATLRRRTA